MYSSGIKSTICCGVDFAIQRLARTMAFTTAWTVLGYFLMNSSWM